MHLRSLRIALKLADLKYGFQGHLTVDQTVVPYKTCAQSLEIVRDIVPAPSQ